ncbi:hypothetical protein [Actinokineospora sp. NBRC 105648]|uniref:hypothetical protein n=1 Tax=Actinokineospora sp. NBRC 105648 TaxID=3032206 RepID=UPI002556D757|nr:hypothetical protein [Actinokineospora sp. NBRC 105648]
MEHSPKPPLVVALAVAVLLLVTPFFLQLPRADRASFTGMGAATLSAPVRVMSVLGVRWLPDGFTEQVREVTAEGTAVRRVWARQSARAGQESITLLAEPAGQATSPWRVAVEHPVTTEVNGMPGRVGQDATGRATVLTYPLDSITTVQLQVRGLPDGPDTALRIGRSVSRDRSDPLVVAARFGFLPAGMRPLVLGVERAATGPLASITANRPGAADYLRVELAPRHEELPGGQPLTVLGRPAQLSQQPGYTSELRVDLGRWSLTVHYVGTNADDPTTRADIVRIAETVRIGLRTATWLNH